VVFAVVSLNVEYRRPARLDDLLCIGSEVAQTGATSLEFRQAIWRESEAGEQLLTATVRVACLDAQRFKPRRLPASLVQELG
jgi:acyl-CoA thioester hydrolase